MGQSSGQSSAGYHVPDPPEPLGGVRRAIPRCALTGEPLSADTVHIPVRAPIDRQSHDHSPITPVRRPFRAAKRAALRSSSSSPLPALRLPDLLTETLDAELDAELDATLGDALERQDADA